MVALHNKRLNDKDIFRGILWTGVEWHAKSDALRAELVKTGLKEPHLGFALARAMEDYQRGQPSFRKRQEIMKAIRWASAVPLHHLTLDQEEMAYLRERLAGVNDPVGQRILAKLDAALS